MTTLRFRDPLPRPVDVAAADHDLDLAEVLLGDESGSAGVIE